MSDRDAVQNAVTRRLDLWTEHLLDTSKRNRLLYFNAQPNSTVRLTEPDLATVWNRLAVRQKTQSFYALEAEADLFDDEEEGDAAPITRALKTDELRTDPAAPRLGRTLYYLRARAKTSLEEQGVVTLFAAFGFLRWNEAAKPNEDIFSPLILVPVELRRESARHSYTLKAWDEDAVLNPALKWKLQNETKIELPDLPPIDDLDVSKYFAAVERLVAKHANWHIWEAAYVGLFSFHKIAMYRDLRDNAERVLAHPLLRALGGDRSSVPPPPPDLPRGSDLDLIAPDDTWQIVDADSSQQEAIQAARRGASFVLQGPPGTGKSQTITNIIAECLAAGKKVLFVSEKMAALQVVYNRLSANGLRDFCLEAHSHKSNKREVVQELGRTLSAVAKTTAPLDGNLHDLARLRQSLNAYARELHARRTPSNLSAYEAIGKLAALQDAPEWHFGFAETAQTSPPQLSRIDEWLEAVRGAHKVLCEHNSHPWRGVALDSWSLQTQGELRVHFGTLVAAMVELEPKLNELMQALGVARFASLNGCDRVLELADTLLQTPHPPVGWLESRQVAPLIEQARQHKEQFTSYLSRRDEMLSEFNGPVFSLPHDELIARLTTRHETSLNRLAGAASRGDALNTSREAIMRHLQSAIQGLADIEKHGGLLAQSLGVEAPRSLAEAMSLNALADLVAKNPRPLPHWFQSEKLPQLEARSGEAIINLSLYLRGRDRLGDYDVDKLLELDLPPLIDRFSVDYAGALRIFKPGFYRDAKLLKSLRRADDKPTPEALLRDLQTALDVRERKTWMDVRSEEYTRDFGPYFNGLQTDWDVVNQALENGRRIQENRNGHVPPALIATLEATAESLEIIAAHNANLRETLAALQSELAAFNALFPLRNFPFSDLPLSHAPLSGLHPFLSEVQNAFADFLDAYDTILARRQNVETIPLASLLQSLQTARELCEEKLQIERASDELRAAFGHFFDGLQTDWDALLNALDWTQRVLQWFGTNPLPQGFVELATRQDASPGKIRSLIGPLRALRHSIADEMQFAHEVFPVLEISGRPIEHAALCDVRDWFSLRLARLNDLDDWLNFSQLGHQSTLIGLQAFWQELLKLKPEAAHIKPGFYRRFWTLWLDEIFRAVPVLNSFAGASHQLAIERFRALDTELVKAARGRLREMLWKEKPASGLGLARGGEMATLQKEVVKKARHKALRVLFGEIPNLLPALKPCLLMSPLSVAQFLQPDKISFDVVIFDEASQICSEDAVGAIMRGKQLIVVGDRKQLPPTRFFGGAGSADLDDEEAELEGGEVYESILDECTTIGLPDTMLRWHYRSRREELIAFSNQHFYENNLVTFPGPFVPQSLGAPAQSTLMSAVSYEKVAGIYIRGKGRDARTNPIEAQIVAARVLEHFEKAPHQSLGVIAFNEAQATAIQIAITQSLATKPHLEKYFVEGVEDAFFVKNLENVQGDERDVILFSIGYGRDQNGKLSMNFGPLNRAGGERRLNVAVTRARLQVHLITSLDPADIDPSRTSARGPALLRSYLEFAKSGGATLQRSSDGAVSSTLEEIVAQSLEAHGWKVQRSVGFSDMRIDLAVQDPAHDGEFLLGIECDGPDYTRAQTARDRDRLRHQVLSDLGWKLERVWSPDWIKNPAAQLARLLTALQDAQAARASAQVASIPSATPIAAPISHGTNALPMNPAPKVLPNDDNVWATQVLSSADFTNGSSSAVNTHAVPHDVVVYRPFSLPLLGAADQFYALDQTRPGAIVNVLCQVVEHEGPLHIQAATRRVVAGWGMSKAGAKLVGIVEDAARRGHREKRLRRRGEFLWPAGMEHPAMRAPAFAARPVRPARRAASIHRRCFWQSAFRSVWRAPEHDSAWGVVTLKRKLMSY